jgi:hypothetical protein
MKVEHSLPGSAVLAWRMGEKRAGTPAFEGDDPLSVIEERILR